jgi:hypothetical protein
MEAPNVHEGHTDPKCDSLVPEPQAALTLRYHALVLLEPTFRVGNIPRFVVNVEFTQPARASSSIAAQRGIKNSRIVGV